jgi:hypothetical protein
VNARRLSLMAVSAFAVSTGVASAVPPVCNSPERLVQWPNAGSPVWEMCLIPPSLSSGTNGSGIEIRKAQYNGHQVFKRAHAPILNVKYVPGSNCDCFRDWSDQETKFEVRDAAGNVINIGGTGNFAEVSQPPRTVCDVVGVPTADIPSTQGFRGVAAEMLPDRMILTTQLTAGWYRYQMKWIFHQDGRMEPRFGFGAVSPNSCLQNTHRHHNYWRFDFDIDGAANDAIGPVPTATHPAPRRVSFEDQRNLPDALPKPAYIVHDRTTWRGYQLVPGPENLELPVDSFSIGDSWMLKYAQDSANAVTAQIDDGQGLSGCPLSSTFLGFDNNESINPADVVVWYRGGGLHLGGDLDGCGWVGPTLQPVGDWSVTP